MKLTDAQTLILQRMADGDVVEYVAPPISRFAWAYGFLPSPRKRSIEILENLELVKVESDAWWGRSYVITGKGREYLAESG